MTTTVLIYSRQPEPRIYHVNAFLFEVLGLGFRIQTERWAFSTQDCTLKSGVLGHQVLLPPGWAATECLVHTNQSTPSDARDTRNDWGYATFIGPEKLIEELAIAERTRQDAAAKVIELHGELHWYGCTFAHGEWLDEQAGQVMRPTRFNQLEPAT